MLTVHGRTRCQFYAAQATGQRSQVKSVSIPVVANGDCASLADAASILTQSARTREIGRSRSGGVVRWRCRLLSGAWQAVPGNRAHKRARNVTRRRFALVPGRTGFAMRQIIATSPTTTAPDRERPTSPRPRRIASISSRVASSRNRHSRHRNRNRLLTCRSLSVRLSA